MVGGGGRPLEATEASSRAQILAQLPKSSRLTTPPGPLKLRLFGELRSRKHIPSFSSVGFARPSGIGVANI